MLAMSNATPVEHAQHLEQPVDGDKIARPKVDAGVVKSLIEAPTDSSTKKKNNPFGSAKPREENVSKDFDERLQEKFSKIDLEREASMDKSKLKAEETSEVSTTAKKEPVKVTPRPFFENLGRSTEGSKPGFNRSFKREEGRFSQPLKRDPPPGYVCRLCFVGGHYIQDCQMSERSQGTQQSTPSPRKQVSSTPPEGYTCKLCNVPGHWIQNCSLATESHSSNQNKEKSAIPPSGYICRLCQIPGHWLQHCSEFKPRLPGDAPPA